MTNDKISPVASAVQYSNGGYGRSLSESEYSSSSAKRPRHEMLPGSVQTNGHETKKYHRLIEKRRRDRINDCIYQLKDLLPSDVIKSTTKPMEKAVILELVVKYMQGIGEKTKPPDSKSLDYVKGYNLCSEKVFRFLNCMINENQREALQNHLLENMPIDRDCSESKNTTPQCDLGDSVSSPVQSNQSQETDNSAKQNRFSTESSLSSSPTSELSCTDHSDSSSCQNTNNRVQKVAKKKVFSHYRSAGSNQAKKQPRSTPNNSPSQPPVFINMPFMMGPGMMPAAQFISTGTDATNTNTEVPTAARMLQHFPVSNSGGVVMPQIGGDATGTVPFPAFFMSCGGQPRSDIPTQQQSQNAPMEPMILQPTLMMPVRSQSNFVLMPSYPLMPQFQSPTLVPLVPSTDTSPSE